MCASIHLGQPSRGFWQLRVVALLIALLGVFTVGCSDDDDDPAPLAAPANLVLTAGDGTVTLDWDPVDGADCYCIYWDCEHGLTKQTQNCIENHEQNQYTLAGLENGEHYVFAVMARDRTRKRDSVLCSELDVILPPSAVTTISVAAGDAVVSITWDDVSGATSYNLYRSTTPDITKLTGTLFPAVTSPYDDTAVQNDTSYYYILEAVGLGGFSRPSDPVSATPRAPLGAPVGVTVTLVEEVTNTLLISWSPPLIGTADSYNIYYDTQPGVTTSDAVITGAVSPYVHSGLAGQTTYYYMVTALHDFIESPPSSEVAGTPHGPPGGGGGGEPTEGYGNNLSFPLLFADGYGLTGEQLDGTVSPWLDYATGLRPTSTQVLSAFPFLDPGNVYPFNGSNYWEQKTESTWQAGWQDGSATQQDVYLDWGDNLTTASFRTNSPVRVEATLYKDDPSDPLDAYQMALLYGSGSTEMQGTNGNTTESTVRTVFAFNARLRIEKLLGPGGAVDNSVTPFDMAVYEALGGDGPGRFGAEVNVGGKLVYGYILRLKDWNLTSQQKLGWWRLTFSLDPQSVLPTATLPGNVTITALDTSETIATLAPNGKSSSIEIQFTQ